MRRVGVFAFGLIALAWLALLGAFAAQAQLLEGTVHEAKLSSSATAYVPGEGLVKEGGKVTVPVVLRSMGADLDRGGFRYAINVLSGPGPGFCVQTPLGILSTYNGESEGLVTLNILEFPEPGQTLRGNLFAAVNTTPGKAGFKAVSGWTEVHDGADPEPDGISKKASLKAKQKDLAKLVDCAIP